MQVEETSGENGERRQPFTCMYVPGLTFCIINNNKKYSQHLVIYFERNKHRTYDI